MNSYWQWHSRFLPCAPTWMCIHTHTQIKTSKSPAQVTSIFVWLFKVLYYTCTCVCMYICLHAHNNSCMYIVDVCVYFYVHDDSCVYVCACIYVSMSMTIHNCCNLLLQKPGRKQCFKNWYTSESKGTDWELVRPFVYRRGGDKAQGVDPANFRSLWADNLMKLAVRLAFADR